MTDNWAHCFCHHSFTFISAVVAPLRDVVEDCIPPLGVHLVELRVCPADGAQTVPDAPAVEQRQNTGEDWSRSGRPVSASCRPR